MPTWEWMKVVHGGCCDARRLQQIVQDELGKASVLRILGAAPRGDPRDYWAGVAGCLGPAADLSVYGAPGVWMDGGFEPHGRAASRCGESAQPLHNDHAAAPELAGAVGVFHVERPGSGAGHAAFIDARHLADCAARHDRGLLERLMQVPVRFGRPGGFERVTPILREVGGRLKVAWNDYRVLPDQSDAARTLRNDFRALLQELWLSGEAAAVPYEAGDTVLFLADEVLHGRGLPTVRHAAPAVVAKAYFDRRAQAGARAA